MYRIEQNSYSNFIELATQNTCNTVYPMSIAEGLQSGDIYADSESNPKVALFLHNSGFAYLSGTPDKEFLDEVYELLAETIDKNNRRLRLETKDALVADYLRNREKLVEEPRYRFWLREDYADFQRIDLPEGYEIREIDEYLFPRITGTVVPSLFWPDAADFLKKGKGFCVLFDGEIASVAFSAAVSSNQIDIGIHTSEKYRRQGLAAIAARKMIEYAISVNKHPVWDCNVSNTGSMLTAKKVGFDIIAEHSFFTYRIF